MAEATDDAASAASALAFIRQVFETYFGGALTGLVTKAYQDYLNDVPLDQIIYGIRQSQEYKDRFPGMADLVKAGRPIREGEYLALERSYLQEANRHDLPEGFLDNKFLGRLIANEKSPTEFRDQLEAWDRYERETRDPTAEAEINRQFAAMGLTPSNGDYLAAIIDPDRAANATLRRLEAGLVATEASRSGFGQVGTQTAFDLASQGVTQAQARQGFDVLAGSRELFDVLPGMEASDEAVEQSAQLGAAFTGDAAARRRIEAQRRRRQGAFEGGGEFASGRSGISGAGGAGSPAS